MNFGPIAEYLGTNQVEAKDNSQAKTREQEEGNNRKIDKEVNNSGCDVEIQTELEANKKVVIHLIPYRKVGVEKETQTEVSGELGTKAMAEMPHLCPICVVEFNSKRAFVQHFNVQHRNRQFICPMCNKVYATPYCMRRHFQHFHMEDDQ